MNYLRAETWGTQTMHAWVFTGSESRYYYRRREGYISEPLIRVRLKFLLVRMLHEQMVDVRERQLLQSRAQVWIVGSVSDPNHCQLK